MSRQVRKNALGKVVMLLLCAMMFSVGLDAATIVVTSEDNGGLGTLRQAILDAESGDTITFDPSVTAVTLTSAIPLDKNLTIDGLYVTVNAQGQSPIFVTLFTPVDVQLQNLILTNAAPAIYCTPGSTIDLADCAINGCNKGAIINSGTMNLENCTLHANSAGGQGGAITNSGKMNLLHCYLYENSSQASGGAVLNYGHLVLTDCVLSQNSATNKGGGMACLAPVTVRSSTIVANSALSGPDCHGAIMSDGANTIGDASLVKGILPTDKTFLNSYLVFVELVESDEATTSSVADDNFEKSFEESFDDSDTQTYMNDVKEVVKALFNFDMPYEDQKAIFSKLYDLETLFNLSDKSVPDLNHESSKSIESCGCSESSDSSESSESCGCSESSDSESSICSE